MEKLKGGQDQIIYRPKRPKRWMEDLADEYGIEVDTVLNFYNSISTHRKERTENFFNLYFEGVKEGNNG